MDLGKPTQNRSTMENNGNLMDLPGILKVIICILYGMVHTFIYHYAHNPIYIYI